MLFVQVCMKQADAALNFLKRLQIGCFKDLQLDLQLEPQLDPNSNSNLTELGFKLGSDV